eukprot:1157367-Pelagomonas_calceolata.AAC.6
MGVDSVHTDGCSALWVVKGRTLQRAHQGVEPVAASNNSHKWVLAKPLVQAWMQNAMQCNAMVP